MASIPIADRREIAGYLAYAREHYVQEAAAIKIAPRNGHTLSLVEMKLIADRVVLAQRCTVLAKELRND